MWLTVHSENGEVVFSLWKQIDFVCTPLGLLRTPLANVYLSLMKALIQVSVERNGNAFYLDAVLFEYIMTISSYLSPEMFYQMFC